VAPPRPLDYLTLDFDAALEGLSADAAAMPELEGLDLSPGSPDRRWLVAVATVSAKLAYYQNRGVNEGFILRARLRQSVIAHAAGLGYTLTPPAPATSPVVLTLPRAFLDSVTIPAGTEITTDDGAVTYTTDAAVTFSAGTTSRTVATTEGRAFTETATGDSPSSSPKGQRVTLAETPVALASDAVTVGGVAWTRVEDFLSSASSDNHYRIERDGQDVATIAFGDGTNGRRPPEGADITIAYRTTLGTLGRVRRNRLRLILGSFRTSGGIPVEPSVNNIVDASGGTDRETIEHARYAAPASVRATDRTVAREDYELHAMEVPGVGRALCHTHIEDSGLPALMHRVYVVPTEGGTANATLLAAVETYLTETKPCPAGVAVRAVSAVYHPQTIAATIYAKKGSDGVAIRDIALEALAALFLPTARDENGAYVLRFARCVPRSQIDAALQAIANVSRVVLTTPVSDASLAAYEFPSLASTPSVSVIVEST